MYANNPAYKLEATFGEYKVYSPVTITEDIHVVRYVAAINQEIYNRAGATKDVIETVCNEIITRANDDKFKTARTEIAQLANSLLYRLKNPVDEHCALRMGHVLSFMEIPHVVEYCKEDPKGGDPIITKVEDGAVSEPANEVSQFWMDKKMQLSMSNPEAYAFFLTMGVRHSETYSKAFDTLTDTNYFQNREDNLRAILAFNNKLTTTTSTSIPAQ